VRLIDALGALEEWRSFELLPKDWAARFGTLRDLFRPDARNLGVACPVPELDEALEEAALALEVRAIGSRSSGGL